MRTLVTTIVRFRNKSFQWPDTLPLSYLVSFISLQFLSLIRGTRVLISLRNPKWMLRGSYVVIRCIHSFRWGRFLKLGEHVHINAAGVSGIHLGNNVSIGAYSRLIASGSISNPGIGIRIGNNVGLGEFAYLGGGGGLEIGDDCIAGQYLSCHPENHVISDPHTPVRLQGVTRKGIKIGRNCWLGSKVTILDGVTIGDNCVIAAGAVVTASFSRNSVIGGVPARLLRSVDNANHTKTVAAI